LDLVFFAQARFPGDSKVIRLVWKIFAVPSGVRKKKLLGIGNGGYVPPNFCTGGHIVQEIAFFRGEGPFSVEIDPIMYRKSNRNVLCSSWAHWKARLSVQNRRFAGDFVRLPDQ